MSLVKKFNMYYPQRMQCEKCHRELGQDEPVYRTRVRSYHYPRLGGACFDCRDTPSCLKHERYEKEWRAPKPCVNCERPVIIKQRANPPKNHILCGQECTRAFYNAWARRKRQLSQRPCTTCGELFDPARSDAKYCGSACRQRAYRMRPQ
jgi:hypothetical protein